jgi:hypothetical protein
MAKMYIYDGSTWRDSCTSTIKIMGTDSQWKTIGNGNKVYANGVWHDIVCVTKYVLELRFTTTDTRNALGYTVNYQWQGQQLSVLVNRTGSVMDGNGYYVTTKYIDVDVGSSFSITYDATYISVTDGTSDVPSGSNRWATKNYTIDGYFMEG